jgi:uncharacterized protein
MDRAFEWDPAKAQSNERKHGISFETATFVFDDPFSILTLDRVEDGEDRWQTLGMAGDAPVLLVVHTIRDEDVEIVRIISARRADRSERKRYEQQAS